MKKSKKIKPVLAWGIYGTIYGTEDKKISVEVYDTKEDAELSCGPEEKAIRVKITPV